MLAAHPRGLSSLIKLPLILPTSSSFHPCSSTLFGFRSSHWWPTPPSPSTANSRLVKRPAHNPLLLIILPLPSTTPATSRPLAFLAPLLRYTSISNYLLLIPVRMVFLSLNPALSLASLSKCPLRTKSVSHTFHFLFLFYFLNLF